MANIDSVLVDVERLVRPNPGEAEERLRALIETMGKEELGAWEVDLRRTINRFYPKRQKALGKMLASRLRMSSSPPQVTVIPRDSDDEVSRLVSEFEVTLKDLSALHIFQWSTFYRDALSAKFESFRAICARSEDPSAVALRLSSPLEAHSTEIFQKGFQRFRSTGGESVQNGVAKSLNGLQRFLDLPLEFYATNLSKSREPENVRVMRALCSSLAGAILAGYTGLKFEDERGGQVLPRFPRSWAHVLPFLTRDQLARLLENLEEGDLRDGIAGSVLPLVEAIDDLCLSGKDYAPAPVLAQFSWEARRLDTSLFPPPYAAEPQLIELQCYLDSGFVTKGALEEAASRDVAVVIAPIRPDLQAVVIQRDSLRVRTVSSGERTDLQRTAVRHNVRSTLEVAIYKRRSPRVGAQPLQYNFAREFPLLNPFLTRYFHVYRSSVRELLRAFERRNGVRLWCSVRRSGKTTACQDLATTTGRSLVVAQTCDNTGQIPDGSLFYDAVCQKLAEGRQLTPSFLLETIKRAAGRGASDERLVFVLDEYETLFGRLKAHVRQEPLARYTVVQPLLNQMVAFARDNLLVFLGQQPNAHFILMDQNQLSAYVQQDPFPLFKHDSEGLGGEFGELLRKVLTDRVHFDLGFANCIYRETAGHPFLTVNLLVEFVDWLIDMKRPVAALSLGETDYAQFAKARLRLDRISLSPEFRFFREAVAGALSTEGRSDNPWLYAVYSCLRALVAHSGDSLECSREAFADFVGALDLPSLGVAADSLLGEGMQANFFDFDDSAVRPRIPLLARIASVVVGRAGA